MKHPNHLYTWRTVTGKYYFSVRAGNNPANAIYTSPQYLSRSGRNYMVNKELKKDPFLIVHRNERPPSKKQK